MEDEACDESIQSMKRLPVSERKKTESSEP